MNDLMTLAIVGDCRVSYQEFKELLEEVVDLKRVEKVFIAAVEKTQNYAKTWCEKHKFEYEVVYPDFGEHKNEAFKVRNSKIVELSGKVVSFHIDWYGIPDLEEQARSKKRRLVLVHSM